MAVSIFLLSKMEKLKLVCILVLLTIFTSKAERVLLEEEDLDRLREDRDLRVFERNGMYVILYKSGRLICLDPNYVNRWTRTRQIEGVPFCGKPKVYTPDYCFWDDDRENGVRTWTLVCDRDSEEVILTSFPLGGEE